MTRYFQEHKMRQVTLLDGFWLFEKKPSAKAEQCPVLSTDAKRTYVPSVWNTTAGMIEYEGEAAYQTTVTTEAGTYRFYFGAVMTEATVWLDGKKLGYHYGGFCPFSVYAENIKAGDHTLTVLVSNRFDEHSIPQAYVDWHHDGGITRSVTMEKMEGLCILSAHAETVLSPELDKATVQFRMKLKNFQVSSVYSPLTITIDGKTVYDDTSSVPAGAEREVLTDPIALRRPRLWSIGNGNLYTFCVQTATDDLIDRFGLRHVEVKDGTLLLNGEPLCIRGVCRHESHPTFGMALHESQMEKDLAIIKELGANSIRGAHYPNHPAFVDILDEEGISFWSEIPIWGGGFSVEALADKTVVERGLAMLAEMTEVYYNHPSILLWGMHNEIKSETEPALAMTKLYREELEKSGGNRLIVFASDRPLTDVCFGLSDLICINNYTGWYRGEIEDWEKIVDEICQRLDGLGLSARPIVFSEFGASAIYGQHTFECLPWSEEYQAKLMEHCISLFDRHPRICGEYIWQFTDGRTALELHTARPRCFNNKGILSEYREPKAAYFSVKKIWNP